MVTTIEAGHSAPGVLQAAFDGLGEGIVVQDADGAIVLFNPAATEILGLDAGQLTGRTSQDPRWRAVHPDGTPWPGVDHPSMRTLRGGPEEHGVVMGVHHADGTRRWLRIATRRLPDPGGVVATFADITREHEALERLRASQERLEVLFEHAPIAKLMVTGDGTVQLANPAAERLLGRVGEDLRGHRLQELVSGAVADLERCMTGEIPTRPVVDLTVLVEGRLVGVEAHLSRLDGGLLAQLLDVTDRRRMEEDLRHLAYRDALTGLRNRHWLQERLEEHLAVARRTGDDGALVVLDVDDFKAINDRWGHDVGDDVLLGVGRVLRRHVRAGDGVVRLGGDEFCLLLPRTDVAAARTVADELVATFAAEDVVTDAAGPIRLSVSVGAAPIAAGATPRGVLRVADAAMYARKPSSLARP